jgi:nucleotide-binding universal stress UspA family protein
MKKILVAVDDTKGSKAAVDTSTFVAKCINPDSLILLYVEKPEGRSLMDEMLGSAEMSTLKNALKGTEFKEALDKRAKTILDYYVKSFEEKGIKGIKTLVKEGHPAEEILGAAKQEGADLIIIGSRGKRVSHLFMGSVSREVANNSQIPVLIVK